MVYTLSNGALNYNSRLHYSLYGGVEYPPDRTLAFKELLPLAAIPAVAITLLVAILNFHIPKISPQTGSNGTTLGRSGTGSSAVISGNSSTGSTTASTQPAKTTTASRPPATTASPVTIIPAGTVGPISSGSDGGQGIIAGRGGDGGTTTTTTDPATTVGASTPIGSASLTTTATTQPTTSQTTAAASVPFTGTSVSVTTGL